MDGLGDWIRDGMTNEAVHRRFRGQNENKNSYLKAQYNCFYCAQCEENINASGKEELKSHFKTIKHDPYGICAHCSKPVYAYRYKEKLNIYRPCGHTQDQVLTPHLEHGDNKGVKFSSLFGNPNKKKFIDRYITKPCKY